MPHSLSSKACSTYATKCGSDPKHYYEDVAPSSWMPEAPETWLELHRRAYCGHADAAFPILFFGLVALACSFQLLAPGLLLAALPVVFVVGLQGMVVSGVPAARLPSDCLSRRDSDVVACCQFGFLGLQMCCFRLSITWLEDASCQIGQHDQEYSEVKTNWEQQVQARA